MTRTVGETLTAAAERSAETGATVRLRWTQDREDVLRALADEVVTYARPGAEVRVTDSERAVIDAARAFARAESHLEEARGAHQRQITRAQVRAEQARDAALDHLILALDAAEAEWREWCGRADGPDPNAQRDAALDRDADDRTRDW